MVIAPDGSQRGPLPMAEVAGVFFGLYTANFKTSINDPVGEYIVTMWSPQEEMRVTSRITFDPPSIGAVEGFLGPDSVTFGKAYENEVVSGTVQDDDLRATVAQDDVSGVVSSGDFSGEVEDNKISGDSNELQLP